MAFVLSLFTDAEMMGVASGAPGCSAGVCAADSAAGSNESAPRAEAQSSFIDEWSEGFHPNSIEERERLGVEYGYVLNPCVYCQYRYLCDNDECAMNCFSLDMRHAPTERGWSRFGL